jgi:hypothetical protein
MWHHFINLLFRSWHGMTAATSTNTLGFILWTLTLTGLGWASTVGAEWLKLVRKKTDSALRKAVSGSLWSGVFLATGMTVLVAIAFVAFVIKTIYQDHEFLVRVAQKAQVDIPAKDNEIRTLKQKLESTCYLPDRHLTQEQREVLYLSMKALAQKTPLRHRQLRVAHIQGDSESSRLMTVFYTTLRDAGWEVGAPLEYPQSKWWGPMNGIAVIVERDTTSMQYLIAEEIDRVFVQQVGIAPDWVELGDGSVGKTRYPMIWIGLKDANK